MKNIVELKDVTVMRDEQLILKKVDLCVAEGSFLGVLGPNGGGKTTLLKVMLGLIKPTEGSVSVFGGSPENARQSVGYVPQQTAVDNDFPVTVMDVVLLGRLIKCKKCLRFNREDKRIAHEALETVNMADFAKKPFGVLSGGERQRVLIARALASEPKLLLLDEPSSSVDVKVKSGLYSLLGELKKRMTLVLVTHDVGTMAQDVNAVACLNKELHYHDDVENIHESIEKVYGCPVDVLAHGTPHRVLGKH